MTTPQNLSYLFLVLTVLYSFPINRLGLPVSLALATTLIHPLTGLPALAWVALLAFHKYKDQLAIKKQLIIKRLILAFTALALPLALFIAGGAHWRSLFSSPNSLHSLLRNFFLSVGLTGRENWLLNFVYFIAHNYSLLILAVIVASIVYFLKKHHDYEEGYHIFGRGLLSTVGALVVALLLSYRLSFNDLISYEQAGYANRILVIIIIFLLPLIINLIRYFIVQVSRQNTFVQSAWLVFSLALLVTSLYLSYPRFDKYWNSRGYSTSANDIEAVTLVNEMSSAPYIALANQQVSAAALSVFGFTNYYQTSSGLIYFYPIPTGGKLYQYYLDMVYKNPDRETMLQALDVAGVNEGYLIVNKYWYQSGRVINQAKLTADNWQDINEEVYIFQYIR